MKPTGTDMILTNARIVLDDHVIERGWVAVDDGRIAEIGEGAAPERGEDLQGDLLMPGLIELHTDHLEAHYVPRPKVYWDPVAAVVSYDGQLATSGITTVLDSLRVWRDDGADAADGQFDILSAAIDKAREAELLRADHFLHLRCEVPMPMVVEDAARLAVRKDVKLMSLMDHTPGQRQFRDAEKLKDYYRGKKGGLSETELEEMFARRYDYQKRYAADNMRGLVALAKKHGVPLASHDDTTDENVVDAVRDEVAVAEFPTTLEAARGLHEAGIAILMGAPNVVRGGSHSGNIAAADLAHEGLLDILSSDYIPSSLLMGALQLPERIPAITLPQAVRTVTKAPAEAVGLGDRGEIAAGKRADLIRVRVAAGVPMVRSVWRAGQRVA
jgi:alpha-D-ribose 1-methylphosphonate 5-triphosphate diphosphatase